MPAMRTEEASASPRSTFCGRHMLVGHRTKGERRNEGGHGGGGEGVGLDGMHPARIKNGTEGYEPDGHGGRLDEKQDHQLGVLGFAQRS